MYENMTYEAVLGRMLDRIPDKFDKREGSIIYDALAPAAAEIACMYTELDAVLNETFADTATRGHLVRRAAERKLFPKQATPALLVGRFMPKGVTVPEGARFSCGPLNYRVEGMKEGREDGDYYYMACELPGVEGNRIFGQLIPVDYIDGLAAAELVEIAIPGENEEDTEAFRNRYLGGFSSQSYGGNRRDYKEKVGSLDGVGGVKVYPVWNGGGTVRLVVIDSMYAVPSATLVSALQEAIDPVQNQGEGMGIAPIGHVVTVQGVTGVAINIGAEITYQEGWGWESAGPYIQAAVDGYFKELAGTWEGESSLVVRTSQVESRILACAGVLDIAGTRLNGGTSNIVLLDDQIPVRGEIDCG